MSKSEYHLLADISASNPLLSKLQTFLEFPSENQSIFHSSISSSASTKLPYDFVSGLWLIAFASSIASNTSCLYCGYLTWNGKPPCKTTCLRKILTALLRSSPKSFKSSVAAFLYLHPCEYWLLHLPYCHRLLFFIYLYYYFLYTLSIY